MVTPRAIIYVRVSDPHQVSGTSLEFQEQECRRYCERNSMEVAGVFRDAGESAKDLSLNNREEFLRALEYCRKSKGAIQHFVVLRVDRFARSTEDHFAVRRLLLNYGVTLHSVTETIGNSPAEKFIETVLAGAAEYDNAVRKQRCVDGMKSKLREGIWPWKPPIGYRCTNSKKRGEKKTRPDDPDPAVFPIIQRGLKEYALGLCTQSGLARELDEWGLAQARGSTTTPQIVDRLLGRSLKFYAGVLINPWTGEEHRGLHQPMITEDELRRIKLVRSGKAFTVRRDRCNPMFPLRRTVLCASCNRRLTGSVSRGNGGRYAYYHCVNRACTRRCKTIPKAVLEREFMEYLERITPKEHFLELFRAMVLDHWKEQGAQVEEHVSQWSRRLAELEARMKRIHEMREDGSYSREEFLERKEALENEIAAAQISLRECRIDHLDIDSGLTYAIKFIRNLARQWLDLSCEVRLRFQQLIFPEGLPYDPNSGFGTAKLGIIYELNLKFSGQESQLVVLVRNSWNKILDDLKEFAALKDQYSSLIAA